MQKCDCRRSTLEVLCDAAAEASRRTEPLKDAVKDPHEELLKKVGGAKQELKRHERELRDAKRRVEDVQEDVQEEAVEGQEAAARMQEAEAEVEASRRGLQACMRSYRQNLAEIFRLSSSLFPELPFVVKGREATSHLATFLLTYEPQVAALLAVDRKLAHYSNVTALSRTPESRHDVDRASFDGQDVALKKYNVKNDDSLKTLYRELVVLSQLKHPNIIPVNLFIIEDKGAVYVEFPLYSSDMEEWLKTSPSYPDVHASVHDVLRAVEHMHRARVVHCDIRPKNILMKQRVGGSGADGATGKWQATLADFDVSLNSGARATIWQTRTEGPRGFEGMLTMAPELRAPLLQGCTPASDMFSFGGLLYVALYPKISPAMVDGDIEVGAHANVDVAPLVRKLLQKDSRARPSASEALAYPLFAAAGANLLAEVQEQQREIERLQEEHRQEEERANRELAQKFRKIQEDERKLEAQVQEQQREIERQQEEQRQEEARAKRELAQKFRKVRDEERKLEEQQERLKRNSSQQQEKERQLREKLESVRREKAKLNEDQKREEKALRERRKTLDEKGLCVRARAMAIEIASDRINYK
jgi:serine/threonine protein kinase